jgi:hypothetical protein
MRTPQNTAGMPGNLHKITNSLATATGPPTEMVRTAQWPGGCGTQAPGTCQAPAFTAKASTPVPRPWREHHARPRLPAIIRLRPGRAGAPPPCTLCKLCGTPRIGGLPPRAEPIAAASSRPRDVFPGLPGAVRPRWQAGDDVVVAPSDHVAGLAALLAAASVPPGDIMGGDAQAPGRVPELGLVALDVGPEVDNHLPARPAFPDEGRPGERRSPG